jgi:hypothetical protein
VVRAVERPLHVEVSPPPGGPQHGGRPTAAEEARHRPEAIAIADLLGIGALRPPDPAIELLTVVTVEPLVRLGIRRVPLTGRRST